MVYKRFFAELFLVLFLVCVPSASAQEISKDNKVISTTGEAKVWIDPDKARVYLGVETMNVSVGVAREENAQKVKSVIDALKGLAIEGMLIKAPDYRVMIIKEEEYNATRQGRLPNVVGYKVVQDFTVLLSQKDQNVLSKNASLVVDTALNSGVTIIDQIEFFKEDDSEDKRRVLSLAVKDAIVNAQTIADAAKVSIKGYNTISSETRYAMPYQMRNANMMQRSSMDDVSSATGTTLLAGKIAVTSTVRIQCQLE
ncbi:MAG: SIMPL domain-containing protein [Candidatus Omnitrophota bacterium]